MSILMNFNPTLEEAKKVAETLEGYAPVWVNSSDNFDMLMENSHNKVNSSFRRFVAENEDGSTTVAEEQYYRLPGKDWEKTEYRYLEILPKPTKKGIKIKFDILSKNKGESCDGTMCLHVTSREDAIQKALRFMYDYQIRQTW